MSELYIFSQYEQPLTILTEDTGLISTSYRIEVNSVASEPFTLTVEADHPNALYVKEENKVVFKDHEGDWRMMVIRELDDSEGVEGAETIATCEPVFLAELNDHIVVDRRFVDKEAQEALNAALAGTRWQGSVEVSLGLATTNFYYLTSVESIWEILYAWGGDFKDVVEFNEETNEILAYKIKIIQRLGAEHGQRFEIDHNTTEIGRTVLSYPKTALYGRGSSLEVQDDEGNHTGGFTRYIDFADVVWSKAKGDPVDKPLGQKWVGDPNALEKHGYLNGNTKKHRFGIYSNQDIEDPVELLRETWNNLQDVAKHIEVNYRLSVELFKEKVSLGDTATAIDRVLARPIEIQARIIAMEYDLLDIDGTTVVEMGQFLNLDDDRLDNVISEVKKLASRPQKVTNNSFFDIKPATPTNVNATGGIRVIQLYWDYDNDVSISHYEVYGSQVKDFVPDSQHLLWRGRVSAFDHLVDTDQVWYYRVRAVNHRGTASEFSIQASTSTVRIISDDILFGSITKDHIADLAIDASKLADMSVTGEKLVNDSITADKILDSAITNAKLAADAVSAINIQNDAVNNEHLVNLAITASKLADDSVTETKIANLAVGSAAIQNLAVKNQHVDNIHANKITAGVIAAERIAIGPLSQFADGYDPTKINVGGTNIFRTSGQFGNTITNWMNNGGGLEVDTIEKYNGFNTIKTTAGSGIVGNWYKLENDVEYTYSALIKADRPYTGNDSIPLHYHAGLNNTNQKKIKIVKRDNSYTSSDVGKYKLIYITFKLTEDADSFRPFIYAGTAGTVVYNIAYLKLEKGNKATDWNPAPVDNPALLWRYRDTVYIDGGSIYANTVTANEMATGTITAASGIIANAAIGTAQIADAAITSAKIQSLAVGTAAIADGAISRAKLGTAVVGTLQVEDGAILNAKIGNLAVDDAKIANMSVVKLKAGTINADLVSIANNKIKLDNIGLYVYKNNVVGASLVEGNLTFNDQTNAQKIGQFAATVWSDNTTKGISMNMEPNRYVSFGHYTGASTGYTPMVVINPGTAMAGVPRGLVSNLPYRANDDVWMGPNTIRFGLNNNHNHAMIYKSSADDLIVASYQSVGLAHVTSGGVANTKLSIHPNEVKVNVDMTLHGLNTRSYADLWMGVKAIRFGVDPYHNNSAIYETNFNDLIIASYKAIGLGNIGTGGVVKQILTVDNNSVDAWQDLDMHGWKILRVAEVQTTSNAHLKQDIVEWNESALDKINALKIYQYRLKRDVEDGINRLKQGLVLGEGYDAPAEFIEQNFVDHYQMASWAFKGIQEQSVKIKFLENRIKHLEELLEVA